jgi:hypothetical protein
MSVVVLVAPAGRLSLAARYVAVAAGNYRRFEGLHAAAFRRRLSAVAAPQPAGPENYALDQSLGISVV